MVKRCLEKEGEYQVYCGVFVASESITKVHANQVQAECDLCLLGHFHRYSVVNSHGIYLKEKTLAHY